MKRREGAPERSFHASILALALLTAPIVSAVPIVDMTVTPLGGSFRYEISVNNTSAEDVILVTITDAPIGDALITATLTAPTGFLASYDSGLGFVDLIEFTALFAAGTTVSGFSFESLSSPASHFSAFQGFEADLDFFSGNINRTIVSSPPESRAAQWRPGQRRDPGDGKPGLFYGGGGALPSRSPASAVNLRLNFGHDDHATNDVLYQSACFRGDNGGLAVVRRASGADGQSQ